MPKCVTTRTYVQEVGERNFGKSMTVPNQAMSPQEILQRFAGGRYIPKFEPEYSDDDFPDPRTLDLTDFDRIAEQVALDKERHSETIKNALHEKAKKARDSQASSGDEGVSGKGKPSTGSQAKGEGNEAKSDA